MMSMIHTACQLRSELVFRRRTDGKLIAKINIETEQLTFTGEKLHADEVGEFAAWLTDISKSGFQGYSE